MCGAPVRPGDIAILFRTRESHREFEEALERRGIAAYVYKGLGFFDADEIKDMLALLWYLADPLSDLRTAALHAVARSSGSRTRGCGGSHRAWPMRSCRRKRHPQPIHWTRPIATRWRGRARPRTGGEASSIGFRPASCSTLSCTNLPMPSEMRGPRFQQARENLKKMRALVRRIQNRGYVTLGRIASHLDRLAVGDEANAVIDALDAVNLMTVHAAKGLEFPIVFLVNLARGTGTHRAIRFA